uniref:L1 transposable element RRM domain-containing protein n=1 Tax=Oryzias latipes TaxID=8090 RepID=A0A3P9K013_ORYLA
AVRALLGDGRHGSPEFGCSPKSPTHKKASSPPLKHKAISPAVVRSVHRQPCPDRAGSGRQGAPKCSSPVLESSAAASIAQTVTERIGELMEEKFLDLRSTLDRLNGRIDDNTRRITESENRISEDEDRITSLENQVSELQQKVKTLTERCDDGENRSRRENIRIIGLKEGSEGQSSVTFFESWLPEVLGMETKRGVIKLDRAHRALGPPKEDRCRPVIIKLHNFTDKQRILTAAREKGEIIYKGSRIYIRQDFSAQVREARQKFNGTCQRLIKGGVRFSMRYPATLCFSLKGAERSFRSAQAAEEFLDKNGLK